LVYTSGLIFIYNMILKPTFYCWIKGLRIEKQAHHSFPDCRVSPVFIFFNTCTRIYTYMEL